jgi:alpha-L-rhamnosidase
MRRPLTSRAPDVPASDRPYGLSAGEQTSARVVPTATPALSWLLPSTVTSQDGFELEAHVDGEFRRHSASSGGHRLMEWPWAPLVSRSRVTWRVRSSDAGKWSGWSEWSKFTTPLLAAKDWQARWISPAMEGPTSADRPAYVLSRRIVVPAAPLAARVYATALGVYEIVLNGERVGDIELAPGSSNYDETLYAQAYDVGELLHVGENRIEIVLSDGWYRGRNGGGQRQNAWGDTTAVLAQLEIEAADGTRTLVVTDESWTSAVGSITRADLMTGQSVDFDRAPDEPSPVRVDEVQRPAPSWSPAPPPRRVEERSPLSLTELRPGISIVDVGQNISGWLRLTDLGAAGQETILEFGEHLDPSGDLTTAHLDMNGPDGSHLAYQQIDRVVAGLAASVFEPRHTVHGFRYARIHHAGRTLDASSITAVVVHSDLRRTGWFESSDPQLDRLHEAAVWSFRGNIVDVPTDCPTRERSGWTGDYQVFAPTASVLFDIDAFSRKWLRAVRDDQYDDGSLAMFSPDSERMKTALDNPARIGGGSAGWGDAAVLVPWTLYRAYGDVDVLVESWESMRRWVEFALRTACENRHPHRVERSEEPEAHEKYLWDGSFHFGEWLEPTPPGAEPVDLGAAYLAFLAADKSEVATAYLHRSTELLSRIAGILGRPDDEERYRALAARIREAWQREYLSDGGRTAQDTQAAYVRALAFDLIPPESRADAAARLVELIRGAGDRLATGFLTTGMLLPVLADTGHADVAFRLLLQHGTPSWLGMLDRGATTVWEDWNGVDEHGHATASLNHYSKGAVIGFLYSHIAGLRQSESSTAWEEFEVRPVLGGGLDHASARFLSPQGPIEASWIREGTSFALTVVVPSGSTATAKLPDGSGVFLTPGRHVLECALEDGAA